jgi:thiamine biosynthesis lipoprotein
MAHKSSRRDFLKGKAALHVVGDLIEQALPDFPEPPPPAPVESYLLHLSRQAMACEFQFLFNAGQYPQATEAALEALDLVEALEEQMSVFRASSEISRLNRGAAEGPVPVERRLFEILRLAQQIHAETAGAYDITSTSLWRAWGFARREGRVPTPEHLAEARRYVGGQFVELDPQGCTVRFLQPGMELNLGSIGKGYALDRAAEWLLAAGVGDFLLHGGQSSVLARGSRQLGTARDGWTVGIHDPLRRGRRIGQLRLRDRALGTSGSANQAFRHHGRRYAHILDPRTGWPAEGIWSATVLAPTAAEADALSTAFCVMGADAAFRYCRARPDLAAVLVCGPLAPAATPAESSPEGQPPAIRTAGLQEGEFTVDDDSPAEPGD